MTALLLALLAAPGLSAISTPPKIKLLVIEGVSNHDWRRRLDLVKAILARDGSFDVEVSITPSAADDPQWGRWRPDFSKYDAVLSGYNNLGASRVGQGKSSKHLRSLSARAVGFMFITKRTIPSRNGRSTTA